MASTSSQKSSFSYDVFLSFRGEDTRKNFTDHLYTALNQKGIITFSDDEELERGKPISLDLLKAIEESRFSIVILSKNFASSKWCLDEVVKIVECIKMKGHMAFPVFHYVDPSDVRKQTGDFKKQFDKHEQGFKDYHQQIVGNWSSSKIARICKYEDDLKENMQRMQQWREAITQVAGLAGWHLQDRHEAELIQEIVREIWRRLSATFSSVAGDFVGIDSRVKGLIEYIEGDFENDAGFIGISGMGGIGKTTIARVAYEKLSSQYEVSCFLADVREVSEKRGLVHLQEQLLSKILNVTPLNIQDVHEGINLIRRLLCCKKVFLVLDDVDQLEQLKWLVGKLAWFGCGSRIVITTRDEHLLTSHGIKNLYKVGGLNHDESIQLLHSKAFKHEQPTNDHLELSGRVVEYTNGLPLALEVLGSLLCDRSVKEWESVLNILQQVPNEKILKKLRISYDGLNKMEKNIFLDIACFFKGKDKDQIMEILDSCGFGPDIGISRLIEKSLITISYNRIWMHDLLQEMGREIVREQHPMKPGKWSRLWMSKDIDNVLTKNMGTQAIEGIFLDMPKKRITHLNGKCFSTMNSLRLLKISKVHISDDLEYLSNELRILQWSGYPLSPLPPSFEPEELIKLDMCYSRIEYLWHGIKPLCKLKTIKLSHSHNLTRTPDFTEVPNLEKLDLEGCTSLLKIHESVVVLKKLTVLNLKGCKNLLSFPSNVFGLKSLKILNLHGCLKLEKLPQNLGEVECLEELDISGTAIRKVPCSSVLLKNLKTLSASGCGYNAKPPESWNSLFFSFWLPKRNSDSMCLQLPPLTGLRSLTKLDLSDCNLSEGGPHVNELGHLSSLEELNLSRNNFASLPESIKQLVELKTLLLDGCEKLQSLPELPPDLDFVGLKDCSLETLMTALKRSSAPELYLYFLNCFKLVENEEKENSLAVMLLKHRLQRLPNRTCFYHILLPGSRVPDWFSHQSDTNELTVRLPPNWLNDKFMGFVVGAVIALPCQWDEKIVWYEFQMTPDDDIPWFGHPIHTTMKYNHLSLTYLAHDYADELVKMLSNSRTIRLRFGYDGGWKKPLVKGCGIRLVYKQDVEYLDVHSSFEEVAAVNDSNAMIRTTTHNPYLIKNRESILWKYFNLP